MLRSMTGYGRADFSIGQDVFTIEVKSVNHRFLEIITKLPERFSSLEGRIRNEIRHDFLRGSFYISIFPGIGGEVEALKLNLPLARRYLSAIEGLKREFNLKGEVDINLLVGFKDIFSYVREGWGMDDDWKGLRGGLKEALEGLKRMREEEGKALLEDISARLATIEVLLSKIEARSPLVMESYGGRLKERVSSILGGAEVDQARLLNEVVIFAERSDISEELVRMRSHLAMFRGMLVADAAIGRKMDFLVQEMVREINTIASKCNDAEIIHLVVDIKGELEKTREQVQNVE